MIVLKSVLLLTLLNPFTLVSNLNSNYTEPVVIQEIKPSMNIKVDFHFESLAEQIERDLYAQRAIATSA